MRLKIGTGRLDVGTCSGDGGRHAPLATPRSFEKLAEPMYTRRKGAPPFPSPAKRARSSLACSRFGPLSLVPQGTTVQPFKVFRSGDASSSLSLTMPGL